MKDLFTGQTYGVAEVRPKRVKRQRNETVVHNDDNHRCYFCFDRNITEQVRDKFNYVYICRSEITWRWYFVFNNSKGMEVRQWNNHSRDISAGRKDVVSRFSKAIGHEEETYAIFTDENISKNRKYTVF